MRHDVGRISIQIVDVALRVAAGLNAGLCVFEETCGTAVALEHNGDVYSCDHFVDPEHLLGNLNDTPLHELVTQHEQQQFGLDKHEALAWQCLRCDVRALCQGGCPKNRFMQTANGEPGLNYLCAGYRAFFRHALPYLHVMADLYRCRQNPAAVMDIIRRNPLFFCSSLRPRSAAMIPASAAATADSSSAAGAGGEAFGTCCLLLRPLCSGYRIEHRVLFST